jgi:hypothetical protein
MMTIQEEWRSKQARSVREARDERTSENVESEIGTVKIPSSGMGHDSLTLCLARKAHSGMSLKKEENIKQTKLIRKQGASGVLMQKQRSKRHVSPGKGCNHLNMNKGYSLCRR